LICNARDSNKPHVVTFMTIFKMPSMDKSEYDMLIEEEYICRIAFKGGSHPYIAPFLYVFDGKFMYFLSTNYGKKVQYFRQNPSVTVEVERFTPDLSNFSFVAIPGRIEEVLDPEIKSNARQKFVELIKKKNLSSNEGFDLVSVNSSLNSRVNIFNPYSRSWT